MPDDRVVRVTGQYSTGLLDRSRPTVSMMVSMLGMEGMTTHRVCVGGVHNWHMCMVTMTISMLGIEIVSG